MFISLPHMQVTTAEDAPMFVPLSRRSAAQVPVEISAGYQFVRANLDHLQDVPPPPAAVGSRPRPPRNAAKLVTLPPGHFQKMEAMVDDCDSTSASSGGDYDLSRIRNLIDTFGLPQDMESEEKPAEVAKGVKSLVASVGSV